MALLFLSGRFLLAFSSITICGTTLDGANAGNKHPGESLIVVISSVIVLAVLVLSIKFLWKPNEKDPGHIKNIIKDNY